jgi:hypothetical protein
LSRIAATVLTALIAGVTLLPVSVRAQDPPDLSIALEPAAPSLPATLRVVADGSGAGIAGRLPRSVVLAIQRGFKLDPAAVAALCRPDQAAASACADDSRVGAGSAAVTANTAFGPMDVAAQIRAFLAPPPAPGDLAGMVITVSALGRRQSSIGRITPLAAGPFGYEVRFEALDQAVEPPEGVTITFKRLELALAASRVESRKVVRRKRVRYRDRRGRRRTKVVRRRVVRKISHAFITTPAACAGSWTARGTVGFADGSSLERDLSVACRPG